MAIANTMRLLTVSLMVLGAEMGVRGDLIAERQQGTSQLGIFQTNWKFPSKFTMSYNSTVAFSYASTRQLTDKYTVMLCQTNATGPNPITSNNTWSTVQINPVCDNSDCQGLDTNQQLELTFSLFPGPSYESKQNGSYFLCLGRPSGTHDSNFVCNSPSPYFDVFQDESPAPDALTPTALSASVTNIPPPTITSALTIPTTVAVYTAALLGTSSSDPPSISTLSTSTLSAAPTGTTTIPAPTDPSESKSSSSSSKGSLPLGAKIGIGLGAAAFLIILLLLALFCLRKRHQKRSVSRSDQLMLTQNGANDSRDLITEKEVQSRLSPDTDTDSGPPVLPHLITQPSALSPYQTLPSYPYAGSAANIPGRNNGSAPTSIASAITTDRAIEIPPASSDSHFEEYRDVPTFAPRGFQHGSFLESEDGHISVPATTPEEAARKAEEQRLEEEEEQRIDAAIAEAERAKARGALR